VIAKDLTSQIALLEGIAAVRQTLDRGFERKRPITTLIVIACALSAARQKGEQQILKRASE
jgi:hypothetical protein